MPTIGMPKVKIQFESMGLTAIQRSERGVCLLLLKEETVKEKTKFKFTSLADVKKKALSRRSILPAKRKRNKWRATLVMTFISMSI